VRFETSEFILETSGEWVRFADNDPEQFQFHSTELGASIVVSWLPAAVPPEKMVKAAQTVLDARIEALDQLDAHRLDDNFVELLDEEQMAHAKQTGQTDSGIYRFEGWVTEAKLINLWVGVEGNDVGRAADIFDNVFGGFSFYVP
jgi:hypothetical protein